MLQRMAGDAAAASLKVLASVVEPPKEYAREELRSYDLYTPLNRMVDAVPPESDCAREFRDLASRIVSGKGTPADMQQTRQWLTEWRDNDGLLQPLLPQSALTAELVPVSHNLHEAAIIGLEALDALEKNQPASASVRQQQLATLKTLEAPQAVLLNRVVPGIEILVQGAKPPS
jgi:hexosaminidase